MIPVHELAAEYDRRYAAGYREELVGYEVARWHALSHLCRRVLRLPPPRSVVDYGAGSGLFVPLWESLFPDAELWCTDLSRTALEELARRHPRHAARVTPIEGGRAALPDAAFDLVVSVEVMEHVAELDAYLADIRRLLVPGGRFVWTTPCANPLSIEHLFSLLTGQIERTPVGERRWRWEEASHLRRLTSREAAAAVRRAGFEQVGFRYRSHLFSVPCTVLFRGRLRPLGERLMRLDYALFRRLPNGASMLGFATRP